jgi:hypothetical protein
MIEFLGPHSTASAHPLELQTVKIATRSLHTNLRFMKPTGIVKVRI